MDADYKISASSVAAFKACPVRFRLAYREGLRKIEDTDSQRMGTNYHKLHEIYGAVLMEGEILKPDRAFGKVVEYLNSVYMTPPVSKTIEEWAVEREVLLQSFVGWLWYWQNDPVEVIASEIDFALPLIAPKVGLPLPMSNVQRVGKIDQLVEWQGAICNLERKSTSRSIAPDSDYWDKAKKDTQVSMYALAWRDMLTRRALPVVIPDGARHGNTIYDVWHKPTIKPSDLTQAETKAFIESGEYCGQKFKVNQTSPGEDGTFEVYVDEVKSEITPGKKGFAIRETPRMYGARLLEDIQKRPEFYYARREIVRTAAELDEFERQLFAVYQVQKLFEKSGCWFENEQQCRATFPCPYIPICYGTGSGVVCDGVTVPDGFKRTRVNLTVRGQEIEE